ncbi:MAG: slipin family protein [Chloroflexi bacterium]|nr:slipin family protein [Chloroflexota bacterium]
MSGIVAAVVIVVLILIIVPAAIRVVPEWERGIMLRFGRFVGIRGPGLIFMIPYVERMVKMDLRVITMDVPTQEVITRDNVTVRVDAVVYFRVVNPDAAVLKVQDHIRATSLISQTTLRGILGQSELDELLAQRDKLNAQLQKVIDEQTDPWGIKVSTVEIKNVELPTGMQRAMSAQAEAERERRAKVVHADGEFQASQKLADAAKIIATEPASLQLRYLQTLVQIATERTNTVVFPLPMDLVTAFLQRSGQPAPGKSGTDEIIHRLEKIENELRLPPGKSGTPGSK